MPGMKKYLTILLLCCSLVPARAQESVPPVELGLEVSLHAGSVAYAEQVASDPIDSDWSAGYAGFASTMKAGKGSLLGRLHLTCWTSAEDKEEWDVGGLVFQQNDMDVSGVDLLAEIGQVISSKKGGRLIPSLGLGYRAQQFNRSSFVSIVSDVSDIGLVSEDYSIAYLNGSLDILQQLDASNRVEARLDLGGVFFNQADNSYIPGDLEGDGGIIFAGRVRYVRELKNGLSVGAGFLLDFQWLQGSTVESDTSFVEWPDNTLERLGVEFSCSKNF